jgi:hypothetical protein
MGEATRFFSGRTGLSSRTRLPSEQPEVECELTGS